MIKYTFKCNTCETVMTIETALDQSNLHMVPPCFCGFSRMELIDLDRGEVNFNSQIEINLGLEEVSNPDKCLCLDCTVKNEGL